MNFNELRDEMRRGFNDNRNAIALYDRLMNYAPNYQATQVLAWARRDRERHLAEGSTLYVDLTGMQPTISIAQEPSFSNFCEGMRKAYDSADTAFRHHYDIINGTGIDRVRTSYEGFQRDSRMHRDMFLKYLETYCPQYAATTPAPTVCPTVSPTVSPTSPPMG